jgi:ABC-type transport system substrate-binding protein
MKTSTWRVAAFCKASLRAFFWAFFWAFGWALTSVSVSAQTPAQAPEPLKVIRYAFPIAETNFDPAQISDTYSRTVASGLFDAPLEYAYLAKPTQMRLATAAAMPEISADFKTFTFRIKPGIYFAPDAAFNGPDGKPVKRELVAEDYVYSVKRHYDPRWKSGNLYILESAQILGLSELRKKLMAEKKPFDYDTPVEGLRTLDRYTFQVKLGTPTPRFANHFADGSFTGALAREVVEKYGDKIGEHPVGTNAFILAKWKRSSKMVLAKNPNYRDVFYDEDPPADNPRLVAAAKLLKGKKLPLVDEVHISVIEEPQPRWLSYANNELDVCVTACPMNLPTLLCPTTPWRPTWPSGAWPWCVLHVLMSRFHTSRWNTRWWVATSRTKWRCAAPSVWAWTWTAKFALCGEANPSHHKAPSHPVFGAMCPA